MMNLTHFIHCFLILVNVSQIYGNIITCSPGDDLLPSPLCCTSFYQCANGVPSLLHCAADEEGEPLVFDPNLKKCVYVRDYPCHITAHVDPNPPPPSTPVLCSPGDDFLPNPDDCNSFYQCANGDPILMQCAANHVGEPPLSFDPNLKRCVNASEYPCGDPNPPPPSTPVLCSPGDDFLPNPDDCNSFYQCANGDPILMQCAANHVGEPPLNFDPNLNRCVYPHEYPCQCHKSSNSDECFDRKLNSTTNCAYCFDCSFKKNRSPACDYYENLLVAKCQNFSYNDVPNIEAGSDPCEIEIYPGRLKNISVTFNIDKNHPLDLYYLMDVSGSMTDDRDNLVLLSGDLIDTLKLLTTDFQIGYGSFIDKPRAPFGNAARKDYSFRNNLPLTKQTDLFMRNFRDTNVPLPDAYDVPESHGDALAQVIECQTEIGWRSYTRRVVLLATDATFHVAGDGALGNINEPYKNNGCHLDSNGYYTKQLTWDYPSVQQLTTAYSMERNTTTVIFATNTSTINFYEQVASQFTSAFVATLNTDSSNILEVVRSEFAKIQSQMKIETSRTNAAIKFRYFSNCSQDGDEIETMFCENLPPSGKVTYTVQVDLDKCPDDPNETGTGFIINPVGLPTFVAVELVFVC